MWGVTLGFDEITHKPFDPYLFDRHSASKRPSSEMAYVQIRVDCGRKLKDTATE